MAGSMENALITTIVFFTAPLCSLIISYLFLSGGKHKREHFLHVFSVTYLFTLSLREINEIIVRSISIWAIVTLGFLIVLLLIRDFENRGHKNLLSHKHHIKFSYAIAVFFIFHSFIDGVLFDGAPLLKSGLIFHRLMDGLIIFGLLAEDGLNRHFFKNLKPGRLLILIGFIVAPLFGVYLSNILGNSFTWGVIEAILMFVLAIVTMVDIRSEVLDKHLSSKTLYLAIFMAIALGLILVH